MENLAGAHAGAPLFSDQQYLPPRTMRIERENRLLFLLLFLPSSSSQGSRTRNRRTTCGVIEGYIAYQGTSDRKGGSYAGDQMPDSCFAGLNMSDCNATSYRQDSADYRNVAPRKPYCAEVCSNANTIPGINGRWLRERDDYTCRVISNEALNEGNPNPTQNENFIMTRSGYDHSNLYMYEFRFRSKSYEGDDTIVTCPLKRSDCGYTATNFLLDMCGNNDNTFLAGYRLRVLLNHAYRDTRDFPDDDKYNDDEFPDRWWAVKSCSAEPIEVLTPPAFFEEHIEYFYVPRIYYYPLWWIVSSVLAAALLLFSCATYYFADECVVCHKKNALMSLCMRESHPAHGLCVVCRLLGAEKPHPEILARLRAEKATRHNGRLHRESAGDLCLDCSRQVGWHQLPPLTCRSAALLLLEFLRGLPPVMRRATVALYYLVAGIVTCGRIAPRGRRPTKASTWVTFQTKDERARAQQEQEDHETRQNHDNDDHHNSTAFSTHTAVVAEKNPYSSKGNDSGAHNRARSDGESPTKVRPTTPVSPLTPGSTSGEDGATFYDGWFGNKKSAKVAPDNSSPADITIPAAKTPQ